MTIIVGLNMGYLSHEQTDHFGADIMMDQQMGWWWRESVISMPQTAFGSIVREPSGFVVMFSESFRVPVKHTDMFRFPKWQAK
jgi:hypothetical protein